MIKPRKKYRRRFLVVGRKPIEEYSVVITSGGNGSVTVDGVAGDYIATVPDGTVLTVSATADAHYGFTAWSDGETDNPRTITVTGDLNLTASFAIDTYIVNVIAGSNGSVSVNGTVGNYSQLVAYGTQLEIAATPAMGYDFTAWSDGVSSASRTVTVTGDVTLSAVFAIQTFTVSISAGANGSVSVNGTPGDYLQTVNYGTALVLEATPSTGYDFTMWSDGDGNSQRIIAVTGDVTLSAAFAIQTFSVSISAGSNGSVSVNGVSGNYSQTVSYGTVLTVEATGNTGYSFTQWSDGSSANPRTVTVTSDITLSSAYAIQTFNVSVTGRNGTVSVTVGGVTTTGNYSASLPYGTVLTLNIIPDQDAGFWWWDVNNGSDYLYSQQATYTVTSATDIVGFCIMRSYFTVNGESGEGKVSFQGSTPDYTVTSPANVGNCYTLQAYPDQGYEFVQWTSDDMTFDDATANPITACASWTEGYTTVVNAVFQPVAQYYNVSISSGANGSITVNNVPGPYSDTVMSGTQLTLEATGDAGYTFTQWSDGNTSNPRTLTVTSNTTLSAAFAIQAYSVTLSAGANGSISVNGTPVVGTYTDTVNYGTQLTIEATPDSHYSFTTWSDGVSTNPRTLTVTSNTTLSAAFAIDTYNVSLSAGANGSISVNGTPVVGTYTDTVNYGTTLTLEATGDTGYAFSQWSDGNSDNPRSLTVTSNTTLTASFQAVTPQQPDDEIWYTNVTTTTPCGITGSFGNVTVVSDTYSNGKGIVKFSGTVTEIRHLAFNRYWDVGTITLPNSVTTIDDAAFILLNSCTSITFGTSLSSIGNSAIEDCQQLNTLTFTGSTVPTLGTTPFDNVASVGTVYGQAGLDYSTIMAALPVGWSLVQPYAVTLSAGANGSISVNGTPVVGTYTDTVSSGTQLTLEATGDTGYQFTQWSDGNTSNPRTLTVTSDVTLTASFQAVTPQQPNDEIWYTSTDDQVVTPYSPTAFGGATITSNTYSGGKGVIKFNQAVTAVGNDAFKNCSTLETVSMADGSITSIGQSAFSGCSGLTTVTISSSVTSIDGGAFSSCSGLTTTNYTGTIAQWCDIIFTNTSSNPAYYSHNLYINGTAVTQLVIPNEVTEIKKYAFFGCSGLTGTLTIPNSVTSIGNAAFSGCSGLTSVTIGSSVTSIGQNAFSGCSGLTSFTIGNSVTSIGYYAFQNCSGLTSVTIPNSVTSIGNYAFTGCSGLVAIESLATTAPTISSSSFKSVAQNGTLTVPSGSDYSAWMKTVNYFLGKYNWTLVQV